MIIYPKYMAFIALYGVLFLLLGVSVAKKLDEIFPSYDPKKSKIKLLGEIILQIITIVVCVYIYKELTEFILKLVPLLRIEHYGNPERTASIIIAPTMFAVQPNLIKKITHVWNLK